jgi:hypothetical protein
MYNKHNHGWAANRLGFCKESRAGKLIISSEIDARIGGPRNARMGPANGTRTGVAPIANGLAVALAFAVTVVAQSMANVTIWTAEQGTSARAEQSRNK